MPNRLARRLRNNATFTERRAWAALRRLRAEGWRVRRQHPLGPYIVDFAILKAKLLIEIDGSIHRIDHVAARDAERQAWLEGEGFRVLRFSGEEALDGDLVLSRVRAVLPRLSERATARDGVTSLPP